MEAMQDFLHIFDAGASAGVYVMLFLFYRLEKRIMRLEWTTQLHGKKLDRCPGMSPARGHILDPHSHTEANTHA